MLVIHWNINKSILSFSNPDTKERAAGPRAAGPRPTVQSSATGLFVPTSRPLPKFAFLFLAPPLQFPVLRVSLAGRLVPSIQLPLLVTVRKDNVRRHSTQTMLCPHTHTQLLFPPLLTF